MTHKVLCTVCMLARGVTLADAFESHEALGEHIHAEHTEKEVERTLNLRSQLRGQEEEAEND